jgi:DNA-binding NarL/FixJ family response regulator
MPQRDLMRTEFFNDFLARDGLHWGVNVFSYAGQRNIGDLRIWRGRHRENFDTRTLELLRLVEPAFAGALVRAGGVSPQVAPNPSGEPRLSQRELEVAQMVCEGLPDKVIAHRLGVEPSTVRTYLKRIFDKLGVHRRSGIAAAVARQR